jgi:DNA-binding LacI/PurR family transcriptional regulator
MTGRTNLVGIYSGRAHLDSRNSFFAELLGGVFEGTGEFGANTVVHSSGGGPERLLALVSNRIIDGLIVHAGSDDPIMRMIGEIRVPAVAVADVVPQLPSIVVDDNTGGRLQAQHLSMRGHRVVLMKNSNSPTFSAQARLGSFKREAERLGLTCIDSFEGFGEEDSLTCDDIKLLSDPSRRVTAVVAWSDVTALRVCTKLDSLGISIPGEIAVVGFDGIRGTPPQKFALTTIRADWAEVGRVAARTVKSLLENASVPKVTTLSIEFVRGTTT